MRPESPVPILFCYPMPRISLLFKEQLADFGQMVFKVFPSIMSHECPILEYMLYCVGSSQDSQKLNANLNS